MYAKEQRKQHLQIPPLSHSTEVPTTITLLIYTDLSEQYNKTDKDSHHPHNFQIHYV